MTFSREDLSLLAEAEEVDIETAPAGGAGHRTTIWIVVDGSDVFVRSVRGEAGRWYREALANPSVAIHVDGRRIPATAVRATDPASIERTSARLREKYARDPAMPPMLQPKTLDTTVRLEPA
ncbi:MAG: nitroreductase/quinone reductase family protein [Chloroflexota bacterium]